MAAAPHIVDCSRCSLPTMQQMIIVQFRITCSSRALAALGSCEQPHGQRSNNREPYTCVESIN